MYELSVMIQNTVLIIKICKFKNLDCDSKIITAYTKKMKT